MGNSAARLKALAKEVRSLQTEISSLGKKTTRLAVKAGRLLLKAKKLFPPPHTGWQRWLKSCGLSWDSSNRYMRLAQSRVSNLQTLPLCEAYIKAGILAPSEGKKKGNDSDDKAKTLREFLAGVDDPGEEDSRFATISEALGSPRKAVSRISRAPIVTVVIQGKDERRVLAAFESEEFETALRRAAKRRGARNIVIIAALKGEGRR